MKASYKLEEAKKLEVNIKSKVIFNYPVILITSIYWLVSIGLYHQYGVKYVADSPRYLEYALGLKSGFYFDPHNFWYISYVLFISVVQLIADNYELLISVQYVLCYLSVLSIYYTSKLLFKSRLGAVFSSVGYILFIDSIYWNSYILAESYYASMLCFSFYFLARLYQNPEKKGTLLMAIPVIILTVLAKPTGIALIGGLTGLGGFWILKRVKSRALQFMAFSLMTMLLLLLANRMLTTFGVIDSEYVRGDIIYGISYLEGHPDSNTLNVKPPVDIIIPSCDLPSVVRIGLFIVQNPMYWLEISSKKVFYFLTHVRPYWSWQHNVYVFVILITAYISIFYAFLKKLFPTVLFVFVGTYFFIHITIAGITTVDWDGRFIIPMLPIVFILAGHSITVGMKKIYNNLFF